MARLGGDEFVVLTEASDATGLAGRIQLAATAPVVWEGQLLEVGCSVGLAGGPVRSIVQLLSEADTALYEAKASGRNQVRVARGSQVG